MWGNAYVGLFFLTTSENMKNSTSTYAEGAALAACFSFERLKRKNVFMKLDISVTDRWKIQIIQD